MYKRQIIYREIFFGFYPRMQNMHAYFWNILSLYNILIIGYIKEFFMTICVENKYASPDMYGSDEGCASNVCAMFEFVIF